MTDTLTAHHGPAASAQQFDENAAVAQMAATLEAEGTAEEERAFPPGVPMDPCVAPSPNAPAVATVTCTYPEWVAAQAPCSLSYLREVVQMAVVSGMTHIRTGSLEMRFDPEARSKAQAETTAVQKF